MTSLQVRPALRPDARASVRSATPTMVAGTGAVALLLFGTRWGSYLGFGGVVFLSDLLMAGAVVLTVIRSARGGAALRDDANSDSVPWAILLAGGYAVLRLLIGGDFSLIAIRDAAPYLYVLVGLLGFYALRRATDAQRRASVRLLVVALVLHALWFSLQLALPTLPESLPLVSATQGLHVFSPRPDVDCTFIGVLAAFVLSRALRFRRHVPALLLVYGACWLPIALSFTRAGVLGAAVPTVFVLVLILGDQRRSSLGRAGFAVVVLVVALIGGGLVLSSSVGTKFIATVAPSIAGNSFAAEGAEGTTRARANAWNRLVHWTYDDVSRATVGVGFGPNFLVDSGASVLLVNNEVGGDTVPRSPHNYWLGSLARLGTIGLVLLAGLVLTVLRRIWGRRAEARDEPFVLLVSCLFLALILPASLGVVLESPFAAMPFWWAGGCLLGVATLRTPVPLPVAEARPARRVVSQIR